MAGDTQTPWNVGEMAGSEMVIGNGPHPKVDVLTEVKGQSYTGKGREGCQSSGAPNPKGNWRDCFPYN